MSERFFSQLSQTERTSLAPAAKASAVRAETWRRALQEGALATGVHAGTLLPQIWRQRRHLRGT